MIIAPGIDGLETYKRILELLPKQKAIIASGFSETDRVQEAQRLGAGAYVNPNVAEIFGPKALRSIYIRPSRNGCPFSRPHRMFNTLSSLKTVNPAFSGTDPIYTVLNSNFMQR